MRTRYATFPLDCAALKAANEAVWKKYPALENRKLDMSPGDYEYRKAWMDAYIAAGGQYQSRKPERKPGDPITTCGGPGGKTEPSPPKPTPPPPPDKKLKCAVISITASCEHKDEGQRSAGGGMVLEVVPGRTSGADRIRLEAQIQAVCGPKHPEWTISGEQLKKGLAANFSASPPMVSAIIPWIPTVTPNKYHVECRCCNGASGTLAVRAYPNKELDLTLDLKKTATWIYTIIKGIESVTELAAEKFKLKLFEGAGSAKAQWQEYRDWRAFYAYEIAVKFSPLLGAECKVTLGTAWLTGKARLLPWLGKYIKKVVDWLVKAGAYVTLSGGLNCEYKWERKTPNQRALGAGLGRGPGVGGTIKLALGVEGRVAGDKVVAVQAELNGEIGATGIPFLSELGCGLDQLKVDCTGLKGDLKVKLLDGWIESTHTVTLIEGRRIYGPKRVYFYQ